MKPIRLNFRLHFGWGYFIMLSMCTHGFGILHFDGTMTEKWIHIGTGHYADNHVFNITVFWFALNVGRMPWLTKK
jgi:hypothetical protein